MNKLIPLFAFSILLLVPVGAQNALAVPTTIEAFDSPGCDPLVVPTEVDELGIGVSVGGPFPPGEELASDFEANQAPDVCPPSTPIELSNVLVEIVNLNSITFSEVWYVADAETSLSNADGFIVSVTGGGDAFRIDADYCDPGGTNLPLIFESMTLDCKFEPGERWHFVIQDYIGLFGGSPQDFDSIGVVSPGLPSTGSIIAIPEPPLTCEEISVLEYEQCLADVFSDPVLCAENLDSSLAACEVPPTSESPAIGGEIIPIEQTSLLLAGAQSFSFMIPVLLSVLGIGIFVVSRKNE